jgi:glycine cleavage system H protein
MLPLNKLYGKDNLCFKGRYRRCPVFQEFKESPDVHGNACPFLEVDTVIYCDASPLKKMIPSSAFRLENPCTNGTFSQCATYQRLAMGDTVSQASDVVNVQGVAVKKGFFYHRAHTWLHRINGTVRVGLDDLGQRVLGRINDITPPEKGKRIRTGGALVRVKVSNKTVALRSPVSGIVVKINPVIKNNVHLLHTDPYGDGWVAEIAPVPSYHQTPYPELLHGPDATAWMQTEIDSLRDLLQGEIGVTMHDGGVLASNIRDAVNRDQWGRIVRTFLERRD